MKRIDWVNQPYCHKGKYKQEIESIFNPGSLITFPQYMAEIVILNRERIIPGFQKIMRGPGWSYQLGKPYINLVQQCTCLCNYFPFYKDDLLAQTAILGFFRDKKVLKVGSYRKIRISKDGHCTITKEEKTVVFGIMFIYDKLVEQNSIKPAIAVESPDNKTVEFDTTYVGSFKKTNIRNFED